jgi:hypothetical protein
MATPGMNISAPPGPGTQPAPPDATPSQPTAASPAPPQPASTATALSAKAIEITSALRTLASLSPKAVPVVRKINDIIQGELMPALMQDQPPGEPQAPPT